MEIGLYFDAEVNFQMEMTKIFGKMQFPNGNGLKVLENTISKWKSADTLMNEQISKWKWLKSFGKHDFQMEIG